VENVSADEGRECSRPMEFEVDMGSGSTSAIGSRVVDGVWRRTTVEMEVAECIGGS